MMIKKKCFFLLLTMGLLCCSASFAQEENNNKVTTESSEIVNAESKDFTVLSTVVTIKDSSKIVSNPENCPIESLRRIGRAIKKSLPNYIKDAQYAGLLNKKIIGKPGSVKFFNYKELSEDYKKAFNSQLEVNESKFNTLTSNVPNTAENLTIKSIINIEEVKKAFIDLIESYNETNIGSSTFTLEEIKSIKEEKYPLMEYIKGLVAYISLSEKGIFGRLAVERDETKAPPLSEKSLNIVEYLDLEPLMLFVQGTKTQVELSTFFKKLESNSNFNTINNIVVACGLDFEKDIISSFANESALYVNLTPDRESQLPDIRYVALINDINRLVSNLPKFKNLASQTGFFTADVPTEEKDLALTQISHFLAQEYKVFAAIHDKFCILASSKAGAIAAINRLKQGKKPSINKDFSKIDIYGRIKTEDLNMQLQQFLSSPIMSKSGIPPISNLTFLKEMKEIEVYSEYSNSEYKIILEIPFTEKKEK